MLSYRHHFHAGNFADVFKHAVLTLLLKALHAKDKPFCYFETHAGAGAYDLRGNEAQKNREFEDGIARVWQRSDVPAALADYVAGVRRINRERKELRFYPGSPRVARALLRPADRMVLCELHSSEVPLLRHEFSGDDQVTILPQDGYDALGKQLPPRERRGLVLIDPAYERKDEPDRVIAAVKLAHARWATGIFAVWYPLQDRASQARWQQRFRGTAIPKLLCAEICVQSLDVASRMNGTGMVIVNPPWKLKEQLDDVLPWLTTALTPDGGGGTRVEWLNP